MIAPRRREIGLGAFLQRMNITKSSGRNLFSKQAGRWCDLNLCRQTFCGKSARLIFVQSLQVVRCFRHDEL